MLLGVLGIEYHGGVCEFNRPIHLDFHNFHMLFNELDE